MKSLVRSLNCKKRCCCRAKRDEEANSSFLAAWRSAVRETTRESREVFSSWSCEEEDGKNGLKRVRDKDKKIQQSLKPDGGADVRDANRKGTNRFISFIRNPVINNPNNQNQAPNSTERIIIKITQKEPCLLATNKQMSQNQQTNTTLRTCVSFALRAANSVAIIRPWSSACM